MACPGFESLLQWLAGPDDPAAAEVAAHVGSGCTRCAGRLRLLDTLASTMGHALPEPVPPELRRRVLDVMERGRAESGAPERGRRSAAAGVGPFLKELVARLVEPAMPSPLAAGLRGGGDFGVLRYEADRYLVELAHIDRRSLLGQVSRTDTGGVGGLEDAVCSLCGAGTMREAALEPDGGFRFADTSRGRYALMIDGPGLRLLVPDVDLTDGDG